MRTALKPLSPIAGILLLVSCQLASAQQIYKWVDAEGKPVFSDQPPPANVKKVESRTLGETVSSSDFPAELASAVRKSPVVLFGSPTCAPCTEARNYLKTQGVPLTEKTVKTNDDINVLTKISGETHLPFIQIGSQKMTGLDKTELRAALDQAGYPAASQLPSSYRYPAPEPAAPVEAPPSKTPVPKAAAKPAASDPFGFRF